MTKIAVELVDFMGTDLSVVNAARVSMDKQSDWNVSDYEAGVGFKNVFLFDRDRKLIQYLNDHQHWTPFAHTAISVRIKAPIFLARQLFKHTVGVVANEVSRRYVDDTPEFHVPKVWRKRAPSVKQGSLEEPADTFEVPWSSGTWQDAYRSHIEETMILYDHMIRGGVAPEQARMVLPQSMMTEWIWTGNLASFARIYSLRSYPHAQREAQEFAKALSAVIAPLFPVSWEILTEGAIS